MICGAQTHTLILILVIISCLCIVVLSCQSDCSVLNAVLRKERSFIEYFPFQTSRNTELLFKKNKWKLLTVHQHCFIRF